MGARPVAEPETSELIPRILAQLSDCLAEAIADLDGATSKTAIDEDADIGGDQDLKDWGAPPEAAAATECAGYRREYECLKRNRNLAPVPGMVDRRLDQIKEFLDRNYPSCFAGETWR